MQSHGGWNWVLVGFMLAAGGVLWLFSGRLPWFGRLPGDIALDREHIRVYFPIMTCLVVSIVLSMIAWIVGYFSR